MGAAGGPAAYFAGARLGAIEFRTSLPVSFFLLAVVWSVALPLLLYRAREDQSCFRRIPPDSDRSRDHVGRYGVTHGTRTTSSNDSTGGPT